MKLTDLTNKYYSLSIIGMCKNAGKTTVLNRLIDELSRDGKQFAITSIGRDGEGSDLVTGTHKPGIYVPEGTLVATATQMLKYCDVTREILDTTGFSTPLGEVVIFRARSDGKVQIAGPSLVSQLVVVRDRFRELGADRVMLDGAISRKTLCSHNVSDATILCTGASYDRNIDKVVDDTSFICRLLMLPVLDDARLRYISKTFDRGCLAIDSDGNEITVTDLDKIFREKEIRTVFFGGALSDSMLKPLILSSTSLKNVCFVANDASKFVMKSDTYRKIKAKGADFAVLNGVNPVAVTINPFSAYGFHFDKDVFMNKMKENITLPVVNVEDMR